MRSALPSCRTLTTALLLVASWPTRAIVQEPARITVKSPVVTVVGCAETTAQPHIWALTRASEAEPSATVGFTTAEKDIVAKHPLGRASYQLIGVADFVDVETARQIGVREKLLLPSRMNTTGLLTSGRKVGIKGLLIEGKPPRINLTSVIDLGAACP